jgi:hypothetical protein
VRGGENEDKKTDEEVAADTAASSPLSSDDPRASGMVLDITADHIPRKVDTKDPNGFNHIVEATQEAIANDDLEKIKEEEERKSALEKKNRAAANLLKTILNFPKKISKNTKQGAMLAVVAIASALGANYYYGGERNEQPKEQLTAGQAVSLENFFTQKERMMLEDLAGEAKLSFIDFMKKYAPLVNIDPNNPSTIFALSEMECEILLNSPRAYGLDTKPQQQICMVVRFIEKTVQIYDKNRPHAAYYIPSPYKYVDRTMKLENFYAIALKIVTEAKEAQARKK